MEGKLGKVKLGKLLYLNYMFFILAIFAVYCNIWAFTKHFDTEKALIVSEVVKTIDYVIFPSCTAFWMLEGHWILKSHVESGKEKKWPEKEKRK